MVPGSPYQLLRVNRWVGEHLMVTPQMTGEDRAYHQHGLKLKQVHEIHDLYVHQHMNFVKVGCFIV